LVAREPLTHEQVGEETNFEYRLTGFAYRRGSSGGAIRSAFGNDILM
jgi:hypothetical protein